MISQVASRYAEALFELADEENQISKVYDELIDLNKVIEHNKELRDVLRTPFITKDEKKALIDTLFKDEISKYTKNFLKVLVNGDRTTEFSSIVLEYKSLYNDKYNIEEGKVITAIPLSKEKISMLEARLSDIYKKQVKLTNKVDESILGGVLVKIGNEEIDGSVKSRLEDLKESLSKVI